MKKDMRVEQGFLEEVHKGIDIEAKYGSPGSVIYHMQNSTNPMMFVRSIRASLLALSLIVHFFANRQK